MWETRRTPLSVSHWCPTDLDSSFSFPRASSAVPAILLCYIFSTLASVPRADFLPTFNPLKVASEYKALIEEHIFQGSEQHFQSLVTEEIFPELWKLLREYLHSQLWQNCIHLVLLWAERHAWYLQFLLTRLSKLRHYEWQGELLSPLQIITEVIEICFHRHWEFWVNFQRKKAVWSDQTPTLTDRYKPRHGTDRLIDVPCRLHYASPFQRSSDISTLFPDPIV